MSGNHNMYCSANELADAIDKASTVMDTLPYAYKAATMLRQQQAEIEALKRPNNVVGVPQDKLADMQATIRQQQAEIEALKERIAYLEAQVYGGSTK